MSIILNGGITSTDLLSLKLKILEKQKSNLRDEFDKSTTQSNCMACITLAALCGYDELCEEMMSDLQFEIESQQMDEFDVNRFDENRGDYFNEKYEKDGREQEEVR